MSAAGGSVQVIENHCSSILAPNDSQNWNVDFNLRRSTLAILDQPPCPPPPPPPPVEDEEANCDTQCSEVGMQLSHSSGNDEEGEHAGAGLSQQTPKTKRVIIQHHDGSVVSVGMDRSAAEGRVADEGSPPS